MSLLGNQQGFSFLSMIIVVIYMSVGTCMLYVAIDPTTKDLAFKETVEKLDRLELAIGKYKVDHNTGANPGDLERLFTQGGDAACAPDATNSKLDNWCGPYLYEVFAEDNRDFLRDGWGTNFSYDSGASTITSYGPNKTNNAGAGDDIVRSF